MIEIDCETDFVARTEDFKTFARDIAMHIAAAAPEYVRPEDVPSKVLDKERDVYGEELKGKPEAVQGKIMDGKIAKFYEGVCLIKQPYIKDGDKSIEELTTELIAKTGENIVIRRFSRLELGQEA